MSGSMPAGSDWRSWLETVSLISFETGLESLDRGISNELMIVLRIGWSLHKKTEGRKMEKTLETIEAI